MKVQINHQNQEFDSYRANRVKSLFNAEKNGFKREFNLPDDDDWQIGLIVGPSGSGKTSIGKQMFNGAGISDLYSEWPQDQPIIDAIGVGQPIDNATAALAAVGLGDVPSWLKPFHCLSNGQKFRAGLARCVVQPPEELIIDEFTSVVDRQIAKIGALAFSKAWRRTKGKKAVLLSCHYDVIEWLQPDWVLNTETGEVKKKSNCQSGQSSSLIFGRSSNITGNHLKSIII